MSLDSSLNFRCESALVWRLERLSRVLRTDVPDLMRNALTEFVTAEEQRLHLPPLNSHAVNRAAELLRLLAKRGTSSERSAWTSELSGLLDSSESLKFEVNRRAVLATIGSPNSSPKERVEAHCRLEELDRSPLAHPTNEHPVNYRSTRR